MMNDIMVVMPHAEIKHQEIRKALSRRATYYYYYYYYYYCTPSSTD